MFLKPLSTAGSIYAYAPPSFCTIDGDGGDGGAGGAAAPEITDTRSAAVAFEGLLDDIAGAGEDGADDTESDASASDAGREETPATGKEEGQTEPPADQAAAIEPPKSWSDEEKAVFSKLPPDAQKVISAREGERDKLIYQRTEEVANQRKAHEAERTAIQTERQTYLQSLQQLTGFVLPELQKFEGVDWDRLAAERPADWSVLKQQQESLRGRHAAIQAEMQRVNGAAKAEHDKRMQDLRAEQGRLLRDKVADFADPVKAPKLSADIVQHLQSGYGFTPEEIGTALDHRLFLVGIDAMKWRQHEAALKVAETKRANTPPTVQRAGTAQGSDTGAAKQAQERSDRLRQTGNVRDAAKLFELMI
jgi:hypothetical protein